MSKRSSIFTAAIQKHRWMRDRLSDWHIIANLLVVAFGFLIALAPTSLANDSAASVGTGGIQLRREVRISLEKERLTISDTKVTVDYDFLNETDRDITSEVAFPIPPYSCGDVEDCPLDELNDFRVSVDGQNILPLSDVKAMSKQHVKTYHWSQTFPANKIIHVSHVYSPITGYEPVQLKNFPKRFPNACIDPPLQRKLNAETKAYLEGQKKPTFSDYYSTRWVDYILITANNWKMPIKDFELVVEKPAPREGVMWSTSFCWNGQVTRIDPNHFSAHVKDFVPTKNLTIFFFLKDQELFYKNL